METDTLQPSLQTVTETNNFFSEPGQITHAMMAVVILLLLSIVVNTTGVACVNSNQFSSGKKKRILNRHLLKLLENPDLLKPVFIILKSIINLAIIVLSVSLSFSLFSYQGSTFLKAAYLVAMIVFVLILTGEILPQILAAILGEALIKLMTWPVLIAWFLLRPFSSIFNNLSDYIRNQKSVSRKTVSMEDITHALKMSDDPVFNEDKEILEGIVKFGNKCVADIMRPRVDVVSLDIKTGFTGVLNLIIDSGFSRIPVFSGSFDNIKGILYIKDILPHSHKANSFGWQTLIRPPFYVPETKKINSLLGEFQKNKIHLAIVIDEYGGTSGIVTLEDVLEEIVGEIVDEFDEENLLYSQTGENTWLFDGKILFEDFIKVTQSNEADFEKIKAEAETLAGFILELKGAIPKLHEKIEFNRYTFTIEEADERRIIKIKAEIEKL